MSFTFNPVQHRLDLVNGIGVSTLGNSSGSTGTVNGDIVFAGGNNITLSQSTNGQNATITISAGAGAFTAGMSNLGNTSGTTGTIQSQIIIAGGNNITLSQSINGNSATLTISAFNQSVESQSLGISNLGNTAGTSGIASGGQVRGVFAGGNQITLSQSLNGASATITVSGPNPGVISQNLQFWQNAVPGGTNDLVGQGTSNKTMWIFPLDLGNAIFPGDMTVKTLQLNMSNSGAIGTAAHSYTVELAFYTVSGSSTLNLVNSASSTWGFAAATAMSLSYSGNRWLTLDGTLFSNNSLTLSQALYFAGLNIISAGTFQSLSWLGGRVLQSGQRSGTIGASANATSLGWIPYAGQYSATTTGFPSTIHISNIQRTNALAVFVPHLIFNNLLSAF